jgi:hypothetical protein
VKKNDLRSFNFREKGNCRSQGEECRELLKPGITCRIREVLLESLSGDKSKLMLDFRVIPMFQMKKKKHDQKFSGMSVVGVVGS